MAAVQPSIHPWVADGARHVRFGIDLGPLPSLAASVEWAQQTVSADTSSGRYDLLRRD
jgi:hypothetical protein